ncbi:MAG: hypothetical protein IJ561_02795 [Ruminococcus sp.]|nr:hypothetical protein [Ruminococcus sp.]
MDSRQKKTAAAIALIVLLGAVMLIIALSGKGDSGEDNSAPALSVFTGYSSSSPASESLTETTTTAPEVTTTTTTTTTTAATTEPEKEYIEYSFRSKKLFDDHYAKHGAEFGDITQEEYLKLANDLLNSEADTILHKKEKEDNDDVFYDTATGYFLVLSTDGYIRTFFIPDRGIDYYNKQ